MIELALLGIFSRLMTWGLGPIIATRTVAAGCDVVRAVLSDPANQARLATGRADTDALTREAERCEVPFRLPLGTTVLVSLQVNAPTPRVLKTELRLRGRTIAWATWILTAGRGRTDVDLAFQLESRNLYARLVVLLGGRWIARRLDTALAALATASAHAAEEPRRRAAGARRGHAPRSRDVRTLRALPAATVVPGPGYQGVRDACQPRRTPSLKEL
jgi:polyketide cyclase/dehydrase/lipid transport protein